LIKPLTKGQSILGDIFQYFNDNALKEKLDLNERKKLYEFHILEGMVVLEAILYLFWVAERFKC
jgi:hypothetical protein